MFNAAHSQAALFAIDEYYDETGKERAPLIVRWRASDHEH